MKPIIRLIITLILWRQKQDTSSGRWTFEIQQTKDVTVHSIDQLRGRNSLVQSLETWPYEFYFYLFQHHNRLCMRRIGGLFIAIGNAALVH